MQLWPSLILTDLQNHTFAQKRYSNCLYLLLLFHIVAQSVDGTMKRKASEISHWGSNRSEEGPSLMHSSNMLLEIGARHFYSSPKHRVVLTVHGTVFSVLDGSMGDFTVEVCVCLIKYLNIFAL